MRRRRPQETQAERTRNPTKRCGGNRRQHVGQHTTAYRLHLPLAQHIKAQSAHGANKKEESPSCSLGTRQSQEAQLELMCESERGPPRFKFWPGVQDRFDSTKCMSRVGFQEATGTSKVRRTCGTIHKSCSQKVPEASLFISLFRDGFCWALSFCKNPRWPQPNDIFKTWPQNHPWSFIQD